ncbi:FMN-dependent NADPH-azoreductase [Sulfitobacter sp. THAF37]|uniref:NAD(P)H-dependent oxidoreductase n=1 Tax=Sulfitobacter sp. THAF37 TaxID=2587855 RepID=UPI0012686280|nr:NAD(P)H-dependent oxidoreductase [Sulfitobacter sp. THAF37]QFT60348.1 FMN-dependent NADPH-azoreductase [Sulfitobacter sp. THAF37]
MTGQTIQTLINTFTPTGGDVDALLELQRDEIEKLREKATETGWLGNALYRAADGSRLVIVTSFRSKEAKEKWAGSPEFAAHLKRIEPLVAHVDSMPVSMVGAFSGRREDPSLRLAVITGSTRDGRFADKPASWIARKAVQRGFDVQEIDLRDVNLPFFGDPPATDVQRQAVDSFRARIAEFDAYLFTVAEYNHGPTAVLKNALDHAEWRRKPAGLIGYGGVGGARAVEHVRGIAAELEMVSMQTAVHINFADYLTVSKGEKQLSDFAHLDRSADKMLDQLLWWGRSLRTARSALSDGQVGA